MTLSINTNVMSLNAQRNLSTSGSDLATSLQRLSSGLRINSAKDDAAGLAISERFTTQIRGMDQAARNANDGISLSQTAEGAMGEIGNNLQRIRELAVQSRNATNSTTDRAALNAEAQQLKSEIDRVAKDTSFNGTKLLDGSFTDKAFQVGANQGEMINVAKIANASSVALGTWTSPSETNTSSVSGAYSPVTLNNGSIFNFSVAGVAVDSFISSGNTTVTASRLDLGLDANRSALEAAGVTFTGSVAGQDLVFSKADGTSFDIQFHRVGANSGSGFAGADFADTVNIPNINNANHTVDNGTPAAIQTGFANLDISTVAGADAAMLAMDGALTAINSARADMGAVQNRFSSVVANLSSTTENLSAARSRIQDADFAKESAQLSRNQILQQAGTAMLAQANQSSQGVLSLLR